MGLEQTRLMARLFDDPKRRIRNFSVTPGDGQFTAEQLCEQINKALDDVANGTATASPHPAESDAEPIDVREFVKQFDSR